jgi:cytochrome P450
MNDVHHHSKKWKNPFEFNPDRFDESKHDSKSIKEGLYWAPFLYGYRQCIGMDFSFHEMRVLLSMMCEFFLHYRFRDHHTHSLKNSTKIYIWFTRKLYP